MISFLYSSKEYQKKVPFEDGKSMLPMATGKNSSSEP
jgi:hypothetical protein